jgi:acetylornithine deacetylase
MGHSFAHYREDGLGAALDAAIEHRRDAAFALLERLVTHPSVLGAEEPALAELESALAELGFACERVPLEAGPEAEEVAGVPVLPYDGRRSALVARRPPAPGAPPSRSLLINGHLDVVPPGSLERWTGDPFAPRRADGWLLGRGAGDMKGGFAMAILALGALLEVAGDRLGGELVVVAAIEEECTGNGTLATVEAGAVADAALLPEPTALDLLLSGVGVLWLELTVDVEGGHAGTAGESPSAVDVAAELLPVLRELERGLNAEPAGVRHRVNVGRVHAGDWTSSVPTEAVVDVRIGFPAAWSPADAEAWVRDALAEAIEARPALRGRSIRVRPSGLRAEGYALEAGSELARAVSAAHAAAHGAEPAAVASEATTDARFYVNQAGIPALCFGPRARAIHGPDEGVELASIVDGARTLGRFMAAWLAPGEEER